MAASLVPLAAGRAFFGAVAALAAAPLCRWAGVTDRPQAARRIGWTLAVTDAASALAALAASSPSTRRRVASANAATDLVIAGSLASYAVRRSGRARVFNTLACASVLGGAAGWAGAALRATR